jgi:hypothetical protein
MQTVTLFLEYYGIYLGIAAALFGFIGLPLLYLILKDSKIPKPNANTAVKTKVRKLKIIFLCIAFGLPVICLFVGNFEAYPRFASDMEFERQVTDELPIMANLCGKNGLDELGNISKPVKNYITIQRGGWDDINEVPLSNGYWKFYNKKLGFPYSETSLQFSDAIMCIDISYPTTHGCTIKSTQGEGNAGYSNIGEPFAAIKMIAWPEGRLIKASKPAYVNDRRQCSSSIDEAMLTNMIRSVTNSDLP